MGVSFCVVIHFWKIVSKTRRYKLQRNQIEGKVTFAVDNIIISKCKREAEFNIGVSFRLKISQNASFGNSTFRR